MTWCERNKNLNVMLFYIAGKHRDIASSVRRTDGGMSSTNAPLDRQIVQTSANGLNPNTSLFITFSPSIFYHFRMCIYK